MSTSSIEEDLRLRCSAYQRTTFTDDTFEKIEALQNDPAAFFDWLGKTWLEWQTPYAASITNPKDPSCRYYPDGTLSVLWNTVEKHLTTPRKNKAAIIWKGANHNETIMTYQSLYSDVVKCASALRKLGVRKGDRVLIIMPNIPELIVCMLACAHIGAIHTLYHHSYSSESIADRIDDCKPVIIITVDASITGTERDIKRHIDYALDKASHQPKYCIVVERVGKRVHMKPLRDIWYHDLVSDEQHTKAAREPAEFLASNDTLFMLYTSNNTADPKALTYPAAGYLAWAHYTYTLLFDVAEDDTYWCTADIAWIIGHSYIVYGPLMAGQTLLIFEDTVDYDNANRFYDICEKFKVNKVYTTPTILRTLMHASEKKKVFRKLPWLQLVATGGERFPMDVLEWTSRRLTNNGACFVDIYSLTEAGGALCAPIPGKVCLKPGSVARPIPGAPVRLYDSITDSLIETPDTQGAIYIEHPFPPLSASFFGAQELYRKIYWKKSGMHIMFRTNDGAEVDADGYFRLTGRLDDVLHMDGKRLSLHEIEEALLKHPNCKDAAVVSVSDEKRGDTLIAFCVLNKPFDESYHDQLVRELRETVIEEIGESALPSEIKFTKTLPKSPDGSILRDLLKDIAMQM